MAIIILIFGAFIATAIAGLIYIMTRVRKFALVKKLSGDKKWKSRLIAFIPVAALLIWCIFDLVNGVIVIIHLLVFWLFAELLAWVIRKVTKKETTIYWQGVLALILTLVYMSIGWYLAHHVVETDYKLTTQKNLGVDSIRVVHITDSHVGSTFDGEGFAKHLETIQKTNPDLVVVTGDYIEDDTSKEDMVRSCKALGDLKTTYGVFYVYGNHDRGYYSSRGYTAEDMEAELAENNVTVLKDDAVQITDGVTLIGRKDKSFQERMTMEQLLQNVGADQYTIVLDHQPSDFDAQAEAGVDLVLSGHSHGGQMWPVGLLGEWSGANDKTYGLETRGNTTFIVNSGISDWAIRFKTAAIAEFGVIDIVAENDN